MRTAKAWRDDCLQWIEAQVTPGVTATWKNPPRAGEQPKVNAYHIEPNYLRISKRGTTSQKCVPRRSHSMLNKEGTSAT